MTAMVDLVESVTFRFRAWSVRLLAGGDPAMARLMAAPVDDEPLSPAAEARIKVALDEIRAGKAVPFDEVFPNGELTH